MAAPTASGPLATRSLVNTDVIVLGQPINGSERGLVPNWDSKFDFFSSPTFQLLGLYGTWFFGRFLPGFTWFQCRFRAMT